MKQTLLLTLCAAFLFTGLRTDAQTYATDGGIGPYNYTDIGLKAGANMQQIVGYPFTTDYNPGAVAGLYYERRWGVFGIKAEATGSMASFTTQFPAAHNYEHNTNAISDSTTKGEFTNMYVNIPVMAEINTGKHLALLFGAQYTQQISVTDNNGVYTKAWGSDKLFKESNISILFGLEISFARKFKLGAVYAQGYQDINNQKIKGITDTWMTGSGQVYLNYRIKRWYKGKW